MNLFKKIIQFFNNEFFVKTQNLENLPGLYHIFLLIFLNMDY